MFVCDCNEGFGWNGASCTADVRADASIDELAEILSDISTLDVAAENELELPDGAREFDITEITESLTTEINGKISGSCDINNNGSVGKCACNDGFTANDENVCVEINK